LTEFETHVKQIIQRTYNVKSFRFNVPEGFSYKAGQYFYITIRADGKEFQKHFSFSSSPMEKGYVELTKKLTGHEFSNALDALKVDDWARLKAPFGEFIYDGNCEKIAMLTGGIGITPIRSICKFCTDNCDETNIILLYGNRTEEDIAFRDDLEQMQKQNRNLKVIHALSAPGGDWPGHVGRIDRGMVEQEIGDYLERRFYICGPPAMVESMENLLKELKVPREHMFIENFPGY
jgi:ferredoxin-NADP reductase